MRIKNIQKIAEAHRMPVDLKALADEILTDIAESGHNRYEVPGYQSINGHPICFNIEVEN